MFDAQRDAAVTLYKAIHAAAKVELAGYESKEHGYNGVPALRALAEAYALASGTASPSVTVKQS
ncbi:hypothetical protein C7K25_10305 [Gulosibacter molinativorax]|uniref:Uncharacterized protein n=1 Tax=Gulosibacter molinativorax TaxID=256821 RepID=A0ABT7C971_9MICO|nr:hypothetical protein [Gulosibacter molinativorax]